MSYTSFEDISDVCEQFECKLIIQSFVKEKKIELNEYLLNKILKHLIDPANFSNETVICERIISPILLEIAEENELPLWSHQPFDVDKTRNLNGIPDYILAPRKEGLTKFTTPVVCLAEAKKDDFVASWGQASAEMIAAQIKNKSKEIPVFGLVSNGKSWEFGKLVKNTFTINSTPYAAPENLHKIVNVLNWMFCEARKNADKLAEIAKKIKKKSKKLQ